MKVKVMLRQTVSRPVYFGVKPPSGAQDQVFITVRLFWDFMMWGALSDERTNLSLHSFSGSSLAELMNIFYCLRFEALPTWRSRSPYLYPPGTGWPSYTPRHWVPFSSPLTTRRATVEVFELVSIWGGYAVYKYIRRFNNLIRTSQETLCLRYRDQPVNAV
jgi:hypothetical protein